MFSFTCPKCRAEHRLSLVLAGMQFSCPICKTEAQLPPLTAIEDETLDALGMVERRSRKAKPEQNGKGKR
jgi:hypothetical protein